MDWAPLLKLLDHGSRVFVPIFLLSLAVIVTGVAAPGFLEAAGLEELWTDHRGPVVLICAFSFLWIVTPWVSERKAQRSEARAQNREQQQREAELRRRIQRCSPAKLDVLLGALQEGSLYIDHLHTAIATADALCDEGLLAKSGPRPGRGMGLCYVYRLRKGVEPILSDMIAAADQQPPPSP